MAKDTEFYWEPATKTLVGNEGTHINYEFLLNHASLIDKKVLGWSTGYPSEYYLFENLVIGWDPLGDVFISVIDGETQKYLWMNPKVLKHAKEHAKETGQKRWTRETFQKQMNDSRGRNKRAKRKLRKFKTRRKG